MEVFLAVFGEGGYGLAFGEVSDGGDFHSSSELFQALVDPVIVAVEDHGDKIACGPLFCPLLEEL